MRTIIFGTVAILLLLAPVYSQPRPQGPVPVGVITATKQPIARSAEFVGRIEAIDRVDLRARVTGYLDAVLFKEGDRVKEGAPLFRIDQAPFQASVQQAQGALLRAQGDIHQCQPAGAASGGAGQDRCNGSRRAG